jgi:hypothetical protein
MAMNDLRIAEDKTKAVLLKTQKGKECVFRGRRISHLSEPYGKLPRCEYRPADLIQRARQIRGEQGEEDVKGN